MTSLSDSQRDALTELLNIALGRAAASLSQMAHDEVLLSVPYVDLLPFEQALEILEAQTTDKVSAVRQRFSGVFWGEAFLVFPEAQSLELVRTLIGDMVPLDTMTDFEQEAFMEVGNVILNACLGSLANILRDEITSALPEVCQGHGQDLLRKPSYADGGYDVVLLLRMEFTLERRAASGYLMFIIDGKAIQALKDNIDQLLTCL